VFTEKQQQYVGYHTHLKSILSNQRERAQSYVTSVFANTVSFPDNMDSYYHL